MRAFCFSVVRNKPRNKLPSPLAHRERPMDLVMIQLGRALMAASFQAT